MHSIQSLLLFLLFVVPCQAAEIASMAEVERYMERCGLSLSMDQGVCSLKDKNNVVIYSKKYDDSNITDLVGDLLRHANDYTDDFDDVGKLNKDLAQQRVEVSLAALQSLLSNIYELSEDGSIRMQGTAIAIFEFGDEQQTLINKELDEIRDWYWACIKKDKRSSEERLFIEIDRDESKKVFKNLKKKLDIVLTERQKKIAQACDLADLNKLLKYNSGLITIRCKQKGDEYIFEQNGAFGSGSSSSSVINNEYLFYAAIYDQSLRLKKQLTEPRTITPHIDDF